MKGGRATRPAQSPDGLRAEGLRQTIEAEASALFAAPTTSQIPSSPLFWDRLENPAKKVSTVSTRESHSGIRHQFLSQLFENSPDALLLLDASFRALDANQQFEKTFGFLRDDILGQAADSLILPEKLAPEAKWIEHRLSRSEQLTIETQRHNREGFLLDVSLTAVPLVVNGIVEGFYLLYRVISEHKRSQAFSSALYRIVEKSGAAQDLQQFFAAVHGIVDELIPALNFSIALYDAETQLLNFVYFVDHREPAPAASRLRRGLVEYVIRTGQSLLCDPEGAERLRLRGEIDHSDTPLHWLGLPLRMNQHTFGAIVVKSYSENVRFTARDEELLTFVARQLSVVLDHKRSEQALRRSEVRYRSLVQTAVYGMYRSSLGGQFLDVNPSLIGMLGYNSALEVLALDPEKDVFVDAKEYSNLISEFRRIGRMDGFEARWKRKDGIIIVVRISGRAVASGIECEDQPADVLEAIAEDITERRLLEDQFRQSQKMEAVGRLAGGVAHDFNNLLMVIGGYTEILIDQLPPGHALYPNAEAIRLASDRATALTRQLLAFSRKQLLELKVVDPNAIVQDMERLLRPLIGANIELSTNLSPSAGRTRADSGQLGQVIMNLVVNAKDAMPQGGKLLIRTESVSLDDAYRPENTIIQRGPYVLLSVIDSGHGMDRITQARVFEPFFTTKEKGKGTGLGLSTVYGIVKQLGGYIFVQSELGRGTSFSIYLPRVEEELAQNSTAAPASASAAAACETVLLVEDEDSVRKLVHDTLVSRGYRVLDATNGASALDIAASHAGPIHLIVTDIVMPGIGGHEMVQQLAPTRPEAKILFLSGYTEDSVNLPTSPSAPAAFLQKPFTLQNLARKVREILGSAPLVSKAGV